MNVRSIRSITVLSALCAGIAQAASAPAEPFRPAWDIGAQLGLAGMQDMIAGYPNQNRPPYEFGYGSGLAGGLSLGHRFQPNWRAELELGFRQHGLDTSSPAGASADGVFVSRHLMANLYYDLRARGRWQPYVGAGIGRSWASANDYRLNGQPLLDDHANAWAAQLILGVRRNIGAQWQASLDYRYLRTGDLLMADAAGDIMSLDQRSHALVFGMRRVF